MSNQRFLKYCQARLLEARLLCLIFGAGAIACGLVGIGLINSQPQLAIISTFGALINAIIAWNFGQEVEFYAEAIRQEKKFHDLLQ